MKKKVATMYDKNSNHHEKKKNCHGNQNSQAAADEHFNEVELKLEAIWQRTIMDHAPKLCLVVCFVVKFQWNCFVYV